MNIFAYTHNAGDKPVEPSQFTDSNILIPIAIISGVLFIALVVLILYSRRGK